jgi:ribose/xylose/arabinose/galactoside ABC-type transport system permease subunit
MSTSGAVGQVSRALGATQLGRWGAKLPAPLRTVQSVRASGLLLATVALLILLGTKSPTYITLSNLRVVGLQITEVGIVSVGMTMLMISGNVDLSVGSATGLVATATALMSRSMSPVLAILLGLLIGLSCGLFNGILVWRIRISPIIITIGSLSLMYGIALLLNEGADVPNVPVSFTNFGNSSFLSFNISVVFFVVLFLVVWIFLATTIPGRQLYAIGGNKEAAARVGIPIRRFVIATFAFTGLLVGLGGVLLASRFGTASPQFGIGLEVDVITAVILGGVAFTGGEGSMLGVVLAVIFLGILESGIVALGIDPYYADVIKGGALIVAVALDQLVGEQRERFRRALSIRELEEEESERRRATSAQAVQRSDG